MGLISSGADVTADADGRSKSRFEFFHPEVSYFKSTHLWEFLLDSYVGGAVYVYGLNALNDAGHRYLFRHTREEWADYYQRIRRSYYLNYCKTVVDIYISTIYKKGVHRESEDPTLQEFWANADGQGLDWDTLYREQVAVMSQVLGTMLVVVDMPRVDEEFPSLLHQQEANLRPVASVKLPLDLIDFELNPFDGQLEWIIYSERGQVVRDPMDADESREAGRPTAAVQYKVWTRTGWRVYNEDEELLDEGEHHLGRVPVAIVVNEKAPHFTLAGDSALKDIAFINREIYNASSLRQEFMYKQCFPFLAWPIDEGTPGRMKIGTGNFVPYPPEGAPGQYISPPIDPSSELGQYMESLRREIFRHAIVGGGEVEQTQQVTSGVAKAFDFHSTNQNIVRKARNLEDGERDVADIFWRWVHDEPLPDDRATIVYPDDYNIKAINDEIRDATEALALAAGPTAEAEIKFRAIRSVLPDLSDEQEAAIRSEIEAQAEQGAAMAEAAVERLISGGEGFAPDDEEE